MNEQDMSWPILDFDMLPNGMISGLSLPEINEYFNNIEAKNTNHDMHVHADNTEQSQVSHSVPQSSRFATPVGDDELCLKKLKSIPKGTTNRNNWCANMYNKWAMSRRITEFDDSAKILPRTVSQLLNADISSIDYWLSKFIYETRKNDGSRFPSNSLCQITAGINSLFRENCKRIDLFENDDFAHFRSILDLACKESANDGVGLLKRQAEVIELSEEEALWKNKFLGGDSPQQLLDTLLYLNGLHFALRSGAEHRSLSVDQIEIAAPNELNEHYVLTYHENVSKTFSGGLKHRKLQPKCVKHIDTLSISNPSRSHALLLLKYLSLRPEATKAFYLTPLKNVQISSKIWYKPIPVGHNTLAKTIPRLFSNSGIGGYKTNHSLRASCATRLYNEGMDEQLIMERTGHRSLSGVRSYKRTSQAQHYNTSVTIDNTTLTQNINNDYARNSKSNTFNFIFNEGCHVTIVNSKES